METTIKVMSEGGGLILRLYVKDAISYYPEGISWLKLKTGVSQKLSETIFKFGPLLTEGFIDIKIPRSELLHDDTNNPQYGVEIEMGFGSDVENLNDENYFYTYYTIDCNNSITYDNIVIKIINGGWVLAPITG